jgi:hypothetical protein
MQGKKFHGAPQTLCAFNASTLPFCQLDFSRNWHEVAVLEHIESEML